MNTTTTKNAKATDKKQELINALFEKNNRGKIESADCVISKCWTP